VKSLSGGAKALDVDTISLVSSQLDPVLKEAQTVKLCYLAISMSQSSFDATIRHEPHDCHENV